MHADGLECLLDEVRSLLDEEQQECTTAGVEGRVDDTPCLERTGFASRLSVSHHSMEAFPPCPPSLKWCWARLCHQGNAPVVKGLPGGGSCGRFC